MGAGDNGTMVDVLMDNVQASRSHYCIHKTVSKKPNLDEECEALLEDNNCKYFSNAQKLFGLQNSSSLQARTTIQASPEDILLNHVQGSHEKQLLLT